MDTTSLVNREPSQSLASSSTIQDYLKTGGAGMTQRWTLTLGQTLRCTRMARGLTMDFIAEKSGRHQSSLSVIERDKTKPSATFLRNIAPFYGCPWWSDAHNVSWLTAITSNSVPRYDTPDLKTPRGYLDLGVRSMHIVADGLAEDPTIAPLYQQCVELFALPGLTAPNTGDTAPVWAWVVETLAFNEEFLPSGQSVVERATSFLIWTVEHFEVHVLGMRQRHTARALRAWRETRQWSPDELARKASAELDLAGEPPIVGRDIEQIEAAAVEVNILRWIAIAHALEVPLSQIMPTVASIPAVDIEETILQLLHQHGLSPRAIDVVKDLVQLLKSYGDDGSAS